jgi:hypothetical protein
MDTATLYTIVTLISGQHRTSTREFPSAAQCAQGAKLLRMEEPLNSKSQIYCIKHEGPASRSASADFPDGSDE